jgi:hypothetical protein
MAIIAHSAKIRVRWPVAEAMVAGVGAFRLYRSEPGQEIDYSVRLIGRDIQPPRPAVSFAGGYGQGRYGRNIYGRDGGAGEATSGPLADGAYQVAVATVDAAGNEDTAGARLIDSVSLAGTPQPAGVPAGSYAGGVLAMDYTFSADDEG